MRYWTVKAQSPIEIESTQSRNVPTPPDDGVTSCSESKMAASVQLVKKFRILMIFMGKVKTVISTAQVLPFQQPFIRLLIKVLYDLDPRSLLWLHSSVYIPQAIFRSTHIHTY